LLSPFHTAFASINWAPQPALVPQLSCRPWCWSSSLSPPALSRAPPSAGALPMVGKLFSRRAGIILIKFWLQVGKQEQEKRFLARINDPLRQWKLGPMDLESYRRRYDYSRARDMMLKATDVGYAPWRIVRSDDKKRARLNCISTLLDAISYKKISRPKVKLPKRSNKGAYDHQASLRGRKFVAEKRR
jgi:hypothetical protein